MSHPNSKFINNISFSDLTYLTETYNNNLSNDDYNLITGKPKNNLISNIIVDNFFLNIVENSMGERVNINNDFIYKYPKTLETDVLRDN